MGKILLATHLQNRQSQIMEAKKKGVKVIGFFPGNYVPEELIYAAGAVPICLAEGGNPANPQMLLCPSSPRPSVLLPVLRLEREF